jgi:hypothetical protein
MNGNGSTSKAAGNFPAAPAQVVRTSQHRAAQYQKMTDERKRPKIRGLRVCGRHPACRLFLRVLNHAYFLPKPKYSLSVSANMINSRLNPAFKNTTMP